MNNFTDDLYDSENVGKLPFWRRVYQTAFPDMVDMREHFNDRTIQSKGYDRTIILKNGKNVFIEEKFRREDYKDIALEYISNDRTGSPGWVCKPAHADYFAYAILPAGMCYLLPVQQLQSAYRYYKEVWLTDYPIIKARNTDRDGRPYNTLSVCIPYEKILVILNNQTRVSFSLDPDYYRLDNLAKEVICRESEQSSLRFGATKK